MRDSFASELIQLENSIADALNRAPTMLAAIDELVVAPRRTAAKPILTDASTATLLPCRGRRPDHRDRAASAGRGQGDLRLVVALIQLAQHGALIANQFELVGQQLTGINRDVVANDPRTTDNLSRMALLDGGQLADAVRAFTSRNLTLAGEIDQADDAIDRLNRQVFQATLTLSASLPQRELAMRHMLIAMSLERIGDNAVDIAEQCAFLIGHTTASPAASRAAAPATR